MIYCTWGEGCRWFIRGNPRELVMSYAKPPQPPRMAILSKQEAQSASKKEIRKALRAAFDIADNDEIDDLMIHVNSFLNETE